MKDYQITLISETGNAINSIGDSTSTEVLTPVLCGIKSITRNEYYIAASNGLRPEIIFTVNKYEYSGQKELTYEDKRYSVIRTYYPEKSNGISDFEDIELVCQEAV